MTYEGYDVLGRTGRSFWDDTTSAFVTAPTASDTVTLWDSTYPTLDPARLRVPELQGRKYKALIFNAFFTAATAANGFQVDQSSDGGVTWRNKFSVLIAATTYTQLIVRVASCDLRVRIVNSAAAQPVFDWELLGDATERGAVASGALA